MQHLSMLHVRVYANKSQKRVACEVPHVRWRNLIEKQPISRLHFLDLNEIIVFVVFGFVDYERLVG